MLSLYQSTACLQLVRTSPFAADSDPAPYCHRLTTQNVAEKRLSIIIRVNAAAATALWVLAACIVVCCGTAGACHTCADLVPWHRQLVLWHLLTALLAAYGHMYMPQYQRHDMLDPAAAHSRYSWCASHARFSLAAQLFP